MSLKEHPLDGVEVDAKGDDECFICFDGCSLQAHGNSNGCIIDRL